MTLFLVSLRPVLSASMDPDHLESACQNLFESLLTSMVGTSARPAKTHGQILLRFMRTAPACDTVYPLATLQQEYYHLFATRCKQLGVSSSDVLSEGGDTDDNQAWNVSFELAAMATNYSLGDIMVQRLSDYLPVWRRLRQKMTTFSIYHHGDATKSSMQYINKNLGRQKTRFGKDTSL